MQINTQNQIIYRPAGQQSGNSRTKTDGIKYQAAGTQAENSKPVHEIVSFKPVANRVEFKQSTGGRLNIAA